MSNNIVTPFTGIVLLKHPETGEFVMSSKQLAVVTGSRHDNVKRTMETLAKPGTIRFTQIEETQNMPGGGRQKRIEILLVDELDSYVVCAQLSPEFTKVLAKFWLDHHNHKLPTPIETAQLLLASLERNEELEATLAIAAPKMELIEKIDNDNSYLSNMTTISKMIKGSTRRQLFELIEKKKWVFWREITVNHCDTQQPKTFQFRESYANQRENVVMQNISLKGGYTIPQLYFTAKGRFNVEKLWRNEQA